uniref:Rhoptry neck protein n=1 Tax=Babesia orientalis TaxID=273649 RepID=A0A6G9KFL7_9APIC|nr:rhoptry neck protein [Babesia orientalis]
MEVLWLFYFATSLWQVQAVGLLQNPFALDTPLPMVNLLQIGGQDDIPVTETLFGDPKGKPVNPPEIKNASKTQKTSPVSGILGGKVPRPITKLLSRPKVQKLKESIASALGGDTPQKPTVQPLQTQTTNLPPKKPAVASFKRSESVMPDNDFPTIDGGDFAEENVEQTSPEPPTEPMIKPLEEQKPNIPLDNVEPKDEVKIEEPQAPQPEVKLSVTETAPDAGAEDVGSDGEAITALPGGSTSTKLISDEEPVQTVEEIQSVEYDEKDIQKDGDETTMNPSDVIESGKDGMSKMTMNVDQDWLNKERAVEAVQKNLPTGTGYSYKKGAKLLTPVTEEPKMMGGVLQTLIDKEAEVRRRHKEAVQIEHDLRLRVTRETADIIALLSNGKLAELKNEHPLVFARLVEPLKASIALSHLNKTANNIISFYDRNWYLRATPKDKATLLENIRKDTGRHDLFALKVNKPDKMTPEKDHIYKILDGYFNDYQSQKVVRGNQVAKQMLRMFDQASGLYVAPFYTDVVPTLGSTWLNQRFENFYTKTEFLRGEALAKAMPQLVGRFMVMVENGTVLATSTDIQMSLYSLAAVLSKIMDGVTEPTNFLGKRKFYGYMGMCDTNCAKGIATNYRDGDPLKTFVHNKQREVLRWISLYLRDDLLRVDTSIQKLLVEIMFRTTNDLKFRPSDEKVNLHVKSEYVDPNAKQSLLELPNLKEVISKIPRKLGKIPKRLNNIQPPQLITNIAKKPKLTRLSNAFARLGSGFDRFMSGYRLPGRMVDNRLDARSIAPYNAFKTPKKVIASLDDGLMQMVEVAVDMVNLRSSSDAQNLYYQVFNTWVQLQSFHAAIHSFEPQTSKKRTSSKTLGAIFRHLNTSVSKHIEGMPKMFLPFTSLLLQICFYIENSVDGYRRSTLKRLKNFLTGIFSLGIKSRLGPSNFTELQSYLEPQVVYNKSRYVIGRAIISNLVQDFKLMFLNKPAIPMPIIQAITMFLGLWARGSSDKLNLADQNIDIARRIFFLNYMSNKYDLAMTATEIVVQHCAATAPILHLGCVPRNVRGAIKCKNVAVPTTKFHVLKVMQMMDATFEDPLDIIRMGTDLARRCKAMPVRTNIVVKKKKDKKPQPYDTAIMYSELAHRYHCYQEQAYVVDQITKSLLKTKDVDAMGDVINSIFEKSRSITVRQTNQSESGPTLVCPYMEDAPEELRDRYRDRMVKYAASQMTMRRRATEALKNFGNKVADKFSISRRNRTSGIPPLESIVGAVLVGTRQFDGIFFYGGFPSPEKITMPESVTVKAGDGRVVYHGKEFMAELEVLRPLGVNAVLMEKQKNVTKRMYYMDSGTKMDELAFGLDAMNFVVRAHVLTTASTLREMGYDIGKFIWCGYEHGWVADFALHNIIGNSDVPVFNGSYWLLSKQMKVSDVLGKKVRIKHGEKVMDQDIDDINLNVFSSDGAQIAKYPAKKGSGANFANHGANSFTFDTGYGEVSPAAIEDIIRDAEFDEATNTLVVNLDAPSSVLAESPIINSN